jgi:hypothetical protein
MLSAGLLHKNPRSVPSCSSHQAIRKADLSVKTLSTLIWGSTLLLVAFGSAGCSARTAGSAELQPLTPASAASSKTLLSIPSLAFTRDGVRRASGFVLTANLTLQIREGLPTIQPEPWFAISQKGFLPLLIYGSGSI